MLGCMHIAYNLQMIAYTYSLKDNILQKVGVVLKEF